MRTPGWGDARTGMVARARARHPRSIVRSDPCVPSPNGDTSPGSLRLSPLFIASTLTLALVGAALAQPVTAPSSPAIDARRFVRVNGRRFSLDGHPFRFMGANASIMHGLPHRSGVDATLDAIARDGLRVVRVWAFGDQPEGAQPWTRDYAFRLGRDGWVESSFEHLDRVIEGARARDLRVIVVLANRWNDYGGIAQYLSLAGVAAPEGAALTGDRALARFFEDDAVSALYRAHLARVIGRVNARTGVAYRDDPTILAWELINESDVPSRSRESLVRWTRESARYVHSLDRAHLVSAGHIGYTRATQRATWLAVQELPEIDYADAHAYPTQLRSVATLNDLDDFVDDPVQLAHYVVGKPFVWGEMGFTTNARTHRGLARVRWFERFLERSERDDVDGAMAWIYSPSADPPHDHGLFVDAPREARTLDVRAVLARYASRWNSSEGVERNPRLGAAQGEAPLWATRRLMHGTGYALPPTVTRAATRWSFRPDAWFTAEAENMGRWDGFAVSHVYASGVATVTYRFRVTGDSRRAALRASRVRVRMRASSELPGRGEGSTEADQSTLRVSIDGAPVREITVPCDDGLGAWIDAASDAPEVLAALRRVGVHTLRMEVPDGPRANGLCLYGAPTGREPLPDNAGELPGRVVIALE